MRTTGCCVAPWVRWVDRLRATRVCTGTGQVADRSSVDLDTAPAAGTQSGLDFSRAPGLGATGDARPMLAPQTAQQGSEATSVRGSESAYVAMASEQSECSDMCAVPSSVVPLHLHTPALHCGASVHAIGEHGSPSLVRLVS